MQLITPPADRLNTRRIFSQEEKDIVVAKGHVRKKILEALVDNKETHAQIAERLKIHTLTVGYYSNRYTKKKKPLAERINGVKRIYKAAYPLEVKLAVVNDFRNGMSAQEAAKKHDVSKASVYAWNSFHEKQSQAQVQNTSDNDLVKVSTNVEPEQTQGLIASPLHNEVTIEQSLTLGAIKTHCSDYERQITNEFLYSNLDDVRNNTRKLKDLACYHMATYQRIFKFIDRFESQEIKHSFLQRLKYLFTGK